MLLPTLFVAAATLSTAAGAGCAAPFQGQYFSGAGDVEYLELLDVAMSQWRYSPVVQSVPQLYSTGSNNLVEGPTWEAWWTTNSFGPTYAVLPFVAEPLRTIIQNSQDFWFNNIGDGTRSCSDCGGAIAPDGCLCDDGEPGNCDYKQGDGIVSIHDWALEESLSAIVMQSEMLLVTRNLTAAAHYLPLMNRTLNLLESRRETNASSAYFNLLLAGDSSNLMAPSYGAYLLPNGTRAMAYLTGMTVSYIAALDRAGQVAALLEDAATAATYAARRAACAGALDTLLAPGGNYFVKWADPDGTLHGVIGAAQHGYLEATVNHDAVAFGVVNDTLAEAIMTQLVSGYSANTSLRPYNFTITNAPGLDDMEVAPDTWLWQWGTWVNGGAWSSCEARMMLAYYRTGRQSLALDSQRTMMGFASSFRMDNPLVNFGSAVYQPNEPINTV